MSARSEPRIRVGEGPPLLRTGLERAARFAGFSVTDEEEAPIILRGGDDPASGADVDIAAGADTVVVTIGELPDPETWKRILALVAQLLSAER